MTTSLHEDCVFTKVTTSVCLKCPSSALVIPNIREVVDLLFRAVPTYLLATTNLTAQTLMQALINMASSVSIHNKTLKVGK